MSAPLPPVKLPSRPPTPADIEDRAAFDKLADASLADVRAAAEKWRGGLAALITLVTGGLLIKGPSDASDLTTASLIVVTVLAGLGIAIAIIGLWWALKAAAGIPRELDYKTINDTYGSVRIYQIAEAGKAAQALRVTRMCLMLALPLLGAAVIAWWWSNPKPPSPPAFVQVARTAPLPAVCGVLESADNGHLRVKVSGQENPVTIPFADVANLYVKSSC